MIETEVLHGVHIKDMNQHHAYETAIHTVGWAEIIILSNYLYFVIKLVNIIKLIRSILTSQFRTINFIIFSYYDLDLTSNIIQTYTYNNLSCQNSRGLPHCSVGVLSLYKY